MPDPHRSRAWIPNRHESPLHDEERLAEHADERLREAARATGNWAVLRCISALRTYALERRKR